MEKSVDIFRFKRFNVVNERSAMKVNTDGVLLGALMTIFPEDRNLLDIGTGTGTIALMAAQRLRSFAGAQDDKEYTWDDDECAKDDEGYAKDDKGYVIDAIDIDLPSAEEAARNFQMSPWSALLHAHHASLKDFASSLIDSLDCPVSTMPTNRFEYDLIFSNPPYFDRSLQAPQERRNAARHTSTGLSYREILDFASGHLASRGRVALVLPADAECDLTRYARMSGLHLQKITRVRTVPRKAPSRIIAEFSRQRTSSPADSILTIQDGGRYTQEYLDLMHEFYLFA